MLASLKGYRTYLVFAAALIVALAESFGVSPSPGQATVIGQVVDLVETLATSPVVLAVLALIMRSITTTPPGQP